VNGSVSPKEPEGANPAMTARTVRWNRLSAVVVLVFIWALLWGSFNWLSLVGGLLVTGVILLVFPLPPVIFAGRIHPLGVLRFLARFLWDLVVASVQISRLAFRFGHTPRSAVIGVALRVPSDLMLTLTAEAVSLVPGSLIVEVDRIAGVLYLHVLGVEALDQVERVRQSVLAVEARIIAAIGSAAELTRVSELAEWTGVPQ
jgi:multicomponent Na+:H+ antiporter subunit E